MAIPTAVPVPKASSKVPLFDASTISEMVIGLSVTSKPLLRNKSITLILVIPDNIDPLKSGVKNLPPIFMKIFMVPTS